MKTKFHKNYKEVRKMIQKLTGRKSIIFGTLKEYGVNEYVFKAELPFDTTWKGDPISVPEKFIVIFKDEDIHITQLERSLLCEEQLKHISKLENVIDKNEKIINELQSKLDKAMYNQTSSIKRLRETIEDYCVDSFKKNLEQT